MSLEQAMAEQPTKKVEVIGNPNPTSLENALGLEDARGREAAPMRNLDRKAVFGDDSEGEGGDKSEVLQVLTQLREENQELRSERGKYGREVVGPLRADNEAMSTRLAALEQQLQGGAAQATPDPADYARQMFGQNIDIEDANIQQMTGFGLNLLDATERGTRALLSPILAELKQMHADIAGTRGLAATGLSLDQVQKAEEAFPELTDLPETKKLTLVRRLLDAGREDPTPGRDDQGRFVSGAARATARPEQFVEGGTGPVGRPMEDDGRTEKWQQRMERFQELGQTGKRGGGDRQKNLFLDMYRRGDFQ